MFFAATALAQTAPPIILTQPQSQTVAVGSNVTFSVTPTGLTVLPSIGSGTLQLWLKADTGVVTNGAGLVSQWQDQSGNANHAAQASTNLQPTLVSAAGLGGRPAVRFNGIQNNVNGSYLFGAGTVNVPNAMTAFTVYNAFSATNAENMLWDIGIPDQFGANRCAMIVSSDLHFSFWTYYVITPFIVPTNTYRIRTDRLDTNLDTINMFDESAADATNFTLSASGAITPGAGYYLGGVDSSVGPYVGSSRNFYGDIAELVCYRGYLTEADRLAVASYLEQKYFHNDSSGVVTYQWQFDGTNIASAANATLTLTNVQTAESGSYSVIVSDLAGSTTSSNAVLAIGNPPSITVQPQSQEVAQGANVTLSASASGTGPLSFQWLLNGAALAQATDAALSLTNVQAANAGGYAVTVSSPFGSAYSSNAVLTVDLPPVIVAQPQSQAIIVGSNVTLSVAVAGSLLPSVSSGTLQLWLKADTGVVTNGGGLVSQWQDQSGHANHATQASTNLQPTLVSAAGLGGRQAVRFNGIQNNVNGSYMFGAGTANVPNAMTAFTVYNAFSATNAENVIWEIGVPGVFYANRGSMITLGNMRFTFWSYDADSPPFRVPTNTYRIRTDRLDTNLDTLDISDATAASATNFTLSVDGAVTPGAGYYLGGLNSSVGQNVGSSRNFYGDIAELICYRGYLTEADRQTVASYLEQKYFQNGPTNDLTFQWQFDGTNIAGATNASLTLIDLQSAEAGAYSVTISNSVAAITSSNAILTTLSPPVITSFPSNQAVVAGAPVTFSAAVTGTAPLTYQWQFDGANIPGATNTSLTLTNVLAANAGIYWMAATNPYGSAISPGAILSVDETTIQVVSTNAAGAGTVVVSIDLNALGTESGVGFTLNFDPSMLTYAGVVLGSGAIGGALAVNDKQTAAGFLGLGVDLFNGAFSPGTNDVLDVTFQVAPVTNAATTSLTFGNQPTEELVSDPQPQALPAVFLPGNVIISPTALAGDVSPRTNGNEVLNILDWVQEGRFVAGLDTISNSSEFQRADCAPRATQGDGQITVADWVQVGRYAVGLDPATPAGGPTSAVGQLALRGRPLNSGLPRPVMLVPLSQGVLTNSAAVELVAQGNENSLGFSVTFDPAMIRFVNASLGAGAAGAALIQNTNLAGGGALGFVVGYQPPGVFAAGTQSVVNLKFAAVSYSNNAVVAFGNTPVVCQLVDTNASVISANYQNVTLAVGGPVWPALAISQVGSNIVLSWPSAAAALGLQAASSMGANWSNFLALPATNGGSLVVTSSISTNSEFFRLKH